MLTSTYTLVALSVEQTTVRAALQSLLDELRALPGDFSTLAAGRAAQLCAALRQVYDNCHWRKLDKFLVPALRRSTAAADGLLADLERLSSQAASAMGAAEACVGMADRPVPRDVFCDAIECCVGALKRRLEREEHELFPMARAAVGSDAWFAIANQMLAHDAYAQEHRADPRRLRHEPIGHGGREPRGRESLQPESGRRHATLTVAH
jgi:hemerythrin-like domain-containing protein